MRSELEGNAQECYTIVSGRRRRGKTSTCRKRAFGVVVLEEQGHVPNLELGLRFSLYDTAMTNMPN